MKAPKLALLLLLIGIPLMLSAQTQTSDVIPAKANLLKYGSAPVRFLASEAGKNMLLHSPNPKAKDYLSMFHGSAEAAKWPQQPLLKPPSGSVSTSLAAPTVAGCGTTDGTEFNLEPRVNPDPQNEESVDFILNGVSSGNDLMLQGANDFRGFFGDLGGSITGYYVKRTALSGSSCPPDFEGGLPPIPDPLNPNDDILGGGDPGDAADPVRSQFFAEDLRFDFSASGVGLYRVPAANFLSTVACPGGTHHFIVQEVACWGPAPPAGVVVDATTPFVAFQDKPHLAVDQRAIPGTGRTSGEGDVYVTDTSFSAFGSAIHLTACKNNYASLADCSFTITISGADTNTQFSHVRVVPGATPTTPPTITISYINVVTLGGGGGGVPAFAIKWVTCTPTGVGAPAAPTCASPTLVTTEFQPLEFFGNLTDNFFRIATYPKHETGTIGTGTTLTTFVVWDACKVPLIPIFNIFTPGVSCTDADVSLATSTNLGASWTVTPGGVDSSSGHQFHPWIAYDSGQHFMNIAYHTTSPDFFKNRVTVALKQVTSGTTVGAATPMTTMADSPAADPFFQFFAPQFGDYIGVAAHGGATVGSSRVYVGYTSNSVLGLYDFSTTSNPESNNHMTRGTY